MATLGDAVALTLRIDALTRELHREVRRERADLPTLVELADEIAEHADVIATAFSKVNDALEASLARSPRASAAHRRPAALTTETRRVGSVDGRLRRLAKWAKNVCRALGRRVGRRGTERPSRRLWSRRPFRRAPQSSFAG